jgi:hypothetical protein
MTTIEITETVETIALDTIDAVESVEANAQITAPPAETQKAAKPKIDVQPVLQKLFELYPHLFGSQFLPRLDGCQP